LFSRYGIWLSFSNLHCGLQIPYRSAEAKERLPRLAFATVHPRHASQYEITLDVGGGVPNKNKQLQQQSPALQSHHFQSTSL